MSTDEQDSKQNIKARPRCDCPAQHEIEVSQGQHRRLVKAVSKNNMTERSGQTKYKGCLVLEYIEQFQ